MNLLIVGTGGQAKVVLDCAVAMKRYQDIAFLSNDRNMEKISSYPVLFEDGTTDEYIHDNFDEIIVAIGNNEIRFKISMRYLEKGISLAILIHPQATVSATAQIGVGTVVLAGALINAAAFIGKACIINTGAIVEHDCSIGDGVHISPKSSLGGTVSIGSKSWICIGSTVANNVNIGSGAVVGAGATVLEDVPEKVLVAGIPAKIKKRYDIA